jgi:hypothetical protein
MSRPPARLRRPLLLLLLLSLILGSAASAGGGVSFASADAPAPWWRVSSSSAPSYLRPGDTEDVVFAAVSNLGDADADGAKAPITITETLPPGLSAKAIRLVSSAEHQEGSCEPLPALRCTFAKTVQPYVRLEVRVTVEVAANLAVGQVMNQIKVEGGDAATASLNRPLNIATARTPFGVEAVQITPENEGGAPDTQAGSHPFQLTTTLDFNQTLEPGKGTEPSPPALVKNVHFDLPPGLLGDPQATPQCSNLDFSTLFVNDINLCPSNTAVGAALVTLNEPANAGYITIAVPVFNLTPAPGEPARFGFEAFNVPVVLDTAVRTGGDYSVQVNIANATSAAQVLGTQVVFWGEPGDTHHDQSRGWDCIAGGSDAPEGESCEAPSPRTTTPFLTLPTSCEGPLTATLTGDSWSGDTLQEATSIPALEGCAALPFNPSIEVETETHTASTPTGLSVVLKVPQQTLLQAGGLAEADVRDTTVTLPEGVELSPSAANGLQACSEAQIGFTGFNAEKQINEYTPAPAACPDASKVGLVHIKTPLLPHELEGAVYLAAQEANPFGSLIALYLVAEEPVSRVLVKLAGDVELNESTLQAITTFKNTPQVPFEELKLDLFAGPRASLTTPALCGGYPLTAALTPWSENTEHALSSAPSQISITSGPASSACSNPQPFAPAFNAESTNTQAGAFTPFNVDITRHDTDQAVQSVSVHLPTGVAALLSSITPCPEPQASQGTCGPESLIGHSTARAGLGPEPFTTPVGQVFITGPYKGAPFGLSIVTPAIAGPFNLGNVIVRSTINVNPTTAAVTITSDPLPTQLKGIPLQLQNITVTVDRPNFEFNPTSCDPTKIEGTLTGEQGTSDTVSTPFQVQGCGGLPFAPVLTASAAGHGSKTNGTSFEVTLVSKGLGQANIAKVDLQLPKALSSRLPTLQKACLAATFNANPAACDEDSVIGAATIHTPVLNNPLTGPAYLVSHGAAEFPDVEFVLQGEGITLILDGKTQIKNGITYSRFETAPDAPFTRFETTLPAGPHGILTPNVPENENFSLCKTSLSMPAEITSQAGTTIKQPITIAVTGCKGVAAYKTTPAQRLAKALKTCHKDKQKRKRITCEKRARRRYTPKPKSHKVAKTRATGAKTTSPSTHTTHSKPGAVLR